MSENLDRFVTGKDDKIHISQCARCVHWNHGVCAAFPEGVPMPILTNKVDHRKPYGGDHGIQFSPTPVDNPEE